MTLNEVSGSTLMEGGQRHVATRWQHDALQTVHAAIIHFSLPIQPLQFTRQHSLHHAPDEVAPLRLCQPVRCPPGRSQVVPSARQRCRLQEQPSLASIHPPPTAKRGGRLRGGSTGVQGDSRQGDCTQTGRQAGGQGGRWAGGKKMDTTHILLAELTQHHAR